MTHARSIKEVYDVLGSHVVFDRKLLKGIIGLDTKFVNKNEDHMEFFGGATTGLHTVRFLDSDKDNLFIDLLEMDDLELTNALYEARDATGELIIIQSRNVASDVFNITCAWMVHKFHTSTHLTPEEAMEGKVRVITYMYYKFVTSLLFHYFKFKPSKAVADATYAALSNKYGLKKLGSWQALIRYLAENQALSLKIKSHQDMMRAFSPDKSIVYFLNDTQGRIRGTWKHLYTTLMKIHESNERVVSLSSMVDIGGEMSIRETTDSPAMFARYLKGIFHDRNSLVKSEILTTVERELPSMPARMLTQTLEWSCSNYKFSRETDIDELVDVIIEHAIGYLYSKNIKATDLKNAIRELKGAYGSSRSTDVKLLKARVDVEKAVKLATKSTNNAAIAATRTGYMLYIVCRAFAMKYYSAK